MPHTKLSAKWVPMSEWIPEQGCVTSGHRVSAVGPFPSEKFCYLSSSSGGHRNIGPTSLEEALKFPK